MAESNNHYTEDLIKIENNEWLHALDYVIQEGGSERVTNLLQELQNHSYEEGIKLPFSANTPYINTIALKNQPVFPGSREIERRIKSIIRWNAMAMVVRANRAESGIGGHISTYASAATLYEVGFNHFFRAANDGFSGDQIFFQGHASPGMYARAFLEGRLTKEQLKHFRQETPPQKGLSSYPHPWLMSDFWQFATVSMGLGPIMAIYQARFNRYLEDRGLKETKDEKVWCFAGDGETDEPEALGAISMAAREKLDNLIFVVNCNLQRLDGPVRGNGQIIQELETVFRGAGWNVIKVLWGSDWDDLLEKDDDGLLVKRMGEVVDGEYQDYIVRGGAYIREHFFGKYPPLKKMVEHMSNEQLGKMRLGGHDPEKVFAAFQSAVQHKGSPTVILARTVKGYGLGEAGEGKNVTHQQKKLNEEELREFRSRFGIPLSDKDVETVPFYKPDEDSAEMKYLQEQRKRLGGYVPARNAEIKPLKLPDEDLFAEFYEGSKDREVATTMAFGRLLGRLLRSKEIGNLIVPIIPDESRTFGLEALFRQVGIYSHVGQLYEPVDKATVLYYKEAKNGQILEEGITEAGSISSFIAAGTSYATHNIHTIPFFIFYSMFGLQRIGDLAWAASDMQARGFLIGGTSGRTTLAGEGLQHQDGQSHLLAYHYPTLKAYDPAFAYELAVIIEEGLRRMYKERENLLYYLTIMNETYLQPAMPDRKGIREAILKGMYHLKSAKNKKAAAHANLLGSGAILNCAIEAQKILEEKYDIAADVWSVTSYKELYHDAMMTERWNRLHPDKKAKNPYIREALKNAKGVFVAATDYVKTLPESIARWLPGPLVSLGTDGFGRSDTREKLRAFFEVDSRHIALSALYALAREGSIKPEIVKKAIKDLDIDPEKANPMIA